MIINKGSLLMTIIKGLSLRIINETMDFIKTVVYGKKNISEIKIM